MKKIIYLLSISIIGLVSIISLTSAQPWMSNISIDSVNDFKAVKNAFERYWSDKIPEKGSGWKQFKRWEHFWEQRLFPNYEMPDASEIYQEFGNWQRMHKNDKLLSGTPEWRELGPFLLPTNRLSYKSSGMGRVNCIRFHPTQNNTVFVGAASGGIWRSTNSGGTWEPLPMTDFMSLGITDIAFSPSNPKIIYASTGDANGSNMTRSYSVGIIKSTDGGNTWKPTGRISELKDNSLATSIIIHPDNPDIVVAGTNHGIIKSINGGITWKESLTSKYFRHLVQIPGFSNYILAATYNSNGATEIYKTSDGGENWTLKKSFSGANRIVLAAATANPSVVYAILSRASSNMFFGLYRSTDAGENWTLQSDSPNILSISQDGSGTWGQGHYDLTITVAPNDHNLIFIGGIHIWKSTNAGKNWFLINHWTGSYGKPFVHADQHDLVFKPGTNELFSANDGGVYKSSDWGNSWSDISPGLAITQFYKFGTSKTDPTMIVGGTQDNGSHMLKNGKWYHILGGDGMECIVDYADESVIYSENYYGALNRSTNGGNSFSAIINTSYTKEDADWVAPVIQHPSDNRTIYIGFSNVWKSTNRGDNWAKISSFGSTAVITHLAVSAKDPNVIYAVKRNQIYITEDGGGNWVQLQSFQSNVTYIAIDPDNPKHIFISLSGYKAGEKVMEFKNDTWTNISGTLPNVPVNCIVHQKDTHYRLFIATDIGVFVREKDATDWTLFNNKMPNIVVSELEFHYGSGKLRAATFARGIWETDIISCNIQKPTMNITGDVEICSGEILELSVNEKYPFYRWSTGETTPTIKVKSWGEYSVIVEDSAGCSALSEFVNVKVNAIPPLAIRADNNDFSFCKGDSLELSGPSVGFSTLTWSTGESTKKIMVNKEGLYKLSGVTSKNCYASDSVYVVEKPLPEKPQITRSGKDLYSTPAQAYQWYRNGWEISNSNTQMITMLLPGQYTVRVTGENGCTALSDVFDVETNVEETTDENFSVSISPNPAQNKFIIEIKGRQGLALITITDVLGKEFKTYVQQLEEKSIIEINAKDLAEGVYFVKVKSGGNVVVRKVVIAK